MKNLIILILAAGLITISCNKSNLPAGNDVKVTPVKTVESPAIKGSSSSQINPTVFESFPETPANGTLEDKYNLQQYIEKNNILQDIPFSSVNNYKVRFTSDGGAVFSVKADPVNPDYLWKRIPQKLLFDTFQLVNITGENENTRFYSRYSQLIENEITVNNTIQNFSKTETLVQTVGLSLTKENLSYRIVNFTPVVIRQVEKNSLPYQINKLTLQAENTADINIDGDKTLIPWPGISFNNYINQKKLRVTISVSTDKAQNINLAVLFSIQGEQYQLTKSAENTFSAELDLPALKQGKNGLIIELIDQKSLEENSKFQGYTWVIPFIVN